MTRYIFNYVSEKKGKSIWSIVQTKFQIDHKMKNTHHRVYYYIIMFKMSILNLVLLKSCEFNCQSLKPQHGI